MSAAAGTAALREAVARARVARARANCRARAARQFAALPVLVVLLLLPPASASEAAFGPGAAPASAVGSTLGDADSSSPVVSGDGRYVAFRTQARALLGPAPNAATEYYAAGIVRKDLVTGAVALVATPERRSRADGSLVRAGSTAAPAGISDDGRYVLFATTAQLAGGTPNPDPNPATPDVYVRDMLRPLSDPDAYEVVSARDGSAAAAGYRDPARGAAPGAPGLSLSDDGRTAVFVTRSDSNLPAAASSSTPAGQIFVRDLDADVTRLVTRDQADATLPGTAVPLPAGEQPPSPALSGDGRVVVWLSPTADRHARFLPGETTRGGNLLWRDLDAGPAAPARRVSGAADLDDPACALDAPFVFGLTVTGPCYGYFTGGEGMDVNGAPRSAPFGVSDDGRFVLFGSTAAVRPYDAVTARVGVYLADMQSGLSRKRAVRRVVSIPAGVLGGPVEPVVSGDGRVAAVAASAAQFDDVQMVGTFPGGALDTTNVYVLDLAARTIERATRAADGGDYRGPANLAGTTVDPRPMELRLSDDGAVLAFSADDGNLFVGDANDADDVHVVRRAASVGGSRVARVLPPAPAPFSLDEPPLRPLRALHAIVGRARIGRGGVTLVTARVPARGVLTAMATGRVPRARGARATAVRVGSDRRRARRAGRVTLRVAPSPRARLLLRRSVRGMNVTLRVRYRAAAGGSSSVTQRYTLGG